MESALDILETFAKTGEIGLIIVDSLASLVPLVELETKSGDEPPMALMARKLSLWFRRVNPVISRTNTLVIFTNQLRDKVGAYGGGTTTPGGKAVKFYSAYRIEVRIVEKLKNAATGTFVGNKLKITAVKNRFAFPYQSTEVTLRFGEGVDILGSVIDEAVLLGLIAKSGNWYTLGNEYFFKDGEERFNGKQAVRDFLSADDDLASELIAVVKEFS
jgi:recombination protein RecA